jgi:hypothetical protein
MADEPPDEPQPNEEQPTWMTPEGRAAIRIKDLSAGEEYTEDELHRLRSYWTEERTRAVAKWFHAGTPEEQVPRCIPRCKLEREAVAPEPGLDLRAIDLSCHSRELECAATPNALPCIFHLEHANLCLVRMDRAILADARMEYADLIGASLQNAVLCDADLTHACLTGAHLEDAELGHANLRHANLDSAHIERANLSYVRLDSTSFARVHWRSPEGNTPDVIHFQGFDVRGIRYSDPLFDQWVRQTNFIHAKRQTWWNPWRWLGRKAPRVFSFLKNWPPPLWLLWKGTCNCGRSFWRWLGWCFAVSVAFGFVFWAGRIVEVPDRAHNWVTYFYFSIVTFTTLGFGDVTPTGNAGELWVMAEVILGYLALGGLISIFTTKLIPPR